MSLTDATMGRRARRVAALVVLLIAGCGDDGRTSFDMGGDMLTGDGIAPTVRNTTPAEGDTSISRREPFVVRFSEPMNTTVGTISADPGGPIPMARWRWNDVGSTLTVEPNTPWAQGELTLTIDGFEDLAGNPMAEPVLVTFETVDDVRPFVTSAMPDEGETGVSARLESIVLTFSEPMDTTSGAINVLGGAATVAEPEWSGDALTVTFPVADLEYDREYDVGLNGFRDARGNALNGEPVVEDGFLDFSTGPDTDAPRAVRSDPMEGQVDVNAATQPAIEVVFDEAMATDTTTFSLDAGGTPVVVTGAWSGGARVLTVDVDGVLEFDTSYSLDLSSLTDRLGNTLDGSAYLGDGRLDFTVSEDAFDPVVLSSMPVEGATGVERDAALPIQVVFSEAMDASVTSATLTDGTTPISLEGTWASDTTIDFEVPADTLAASTAYQLDLTGFVDLTGNATDATHPYLGDGVLDFTTASPLGESCLDALTEADALVAGGVSAWTVRAGRVTSREGGTDACADHTGSATRPDVVLRYEKVSADVGSGGKLLRVVVDADTTSTEYDVAVIPGACDPAATPARCIIESEVHQLYADVPAGPVHLWISPNSSSTFPTNVTISVEEVDPPRAEGESCDNPYTIASSIFSSSGSVDTFSIPEGMGPRAMDIADFTVTDGSLVSCDPTTTSSTSSENGTGVDAVIRYTMPADSVLRVTAQGLDSSSNPDFNVSFHDRCALDASATEYACIPDVGTTAENGIVEAPPGDIYLWLTNTTTDITRSSTRGDFYFHEARIDLEAIPVDAGETCSRALAAATGTIAVAGSADVAVVTPSCFDAASNVEWYAFTATQSLVTAAADAPGGVALFDGSDELACAGDASAQSAVTLVPAGTTVCVAVEMGQGIGNLSLDERAYTGVGITDPVVLPIERPVDDFGNLDRITSDSWLAGNGTLLVMAYGTEMLDALIDGAGTTLYRGSADGLSSSNMGNAGLFAANGALFSFDDTTVGSSRIYRLWDGSAPFYSPLAWDTPAPTYPADEISAATVVGNTIYYVTAGEFPIFYSLDATRSGTAARIGTNEVVTDVVGIAADDTFLYVAGELKDGGTEGIFRIPFSELSNATYAPPNLASGIDHDGTPFPSHAVAMYVDGPSGPGHLYVRNSVGHVEVVLDPSGGSPLYLGEVIRIGTSGDEAMWLDPSTGALYLFETESDPDGRFLRFDP